MNLRLPTKLAFLSILFSPLWVCQGNNSSGSSNRKSLEVSSFERLNRKRPKSTSSAPSNPEDAKANRIEIVPNYAIGELRIGMKRAELPKEAEATIANDSRTFHGVRFRLNGDMVEDVWIDQLRNFPYELRFQGRTIQRDASVDDLKALFGPCTRVTKVRGGIHYNCGAGVTLGFDLEESARFVEIRLKRL